MIKSILFLQASKSKPKSVPKTSVRYMEFWSSTVPVLAAVNSHFPLFKRRVHEIKLYDTRSYYCDYLAQKNFSGIKSYILNLKLPQFSKEKIFQA